ncbi:methylmalonyl-CoA epimerase [Bacillus sp. AFS018417]|uniref:methylmalonyl-CoA epimerase n=1 Tax=Bacillus sp. AFS018417 TaxID=2033491 RepID=UPI000BF27759|nr:methylmalonyl-CoA epimerase [Bacillus sp. AFS018417]PEZ09144.1 methylmalonyl-CoA epimerase [Bacillus sp. AFS018417]
MIEQIDHIGIAVQSIESVLPFYTEILKLKLLGIEEVQSQQVKVAFLVVGESKLELLEPLSNKSAIAQFIQKRGEGIHHIAFGVQSIKQRIQYIKQNGIQMIDELPRTGAQGAQIAFIHPKSTYGTLYELCDKGDKI